MTGSRKNFIACLFSPGLLLCCIIGLFGCVAIFNATFHTGKPFYFVSRQLIWLSIGIVVLLVCTLTPPDVYEKWTLPIAGVMLALLYFLTFAGTEVNGMRGWFTFDCMGIGTVFFQPSEFAKPAFVLFLAKVAKPSYDQEPVCWKGYILYLAMACVWFLPILLQPDFGTLVLFVIGFACIYWLQGGRIAHLIATVLVSAPFAGLIIHHHRYIQRRLLGFYDPLGHADEAGWHILQLRTTLASGGPWGRSIGDTVWSRNYLPLGHSDSIFATVAESIGFYGMVPIILTIVAWLIYCCHIAKQQRILKNALVVAGLSAMIAAQAFIHISVTLGLLPPTGITLPMISYGGSSLVSTMISIGIISSIANQKT